MARTFCTGIPRMKLAVENCCEQHDKNYGTDSQVSRHDADVLLYQCLLRSGRPVFARVVYLFVRLFGWIFYKGSR